MPTLKLKFTLYKYITNEIWPTFFASLFVSVFIIMATKMLSITELVMNKGVGIIQVFWMITYLLPDILTFALPAVTLISVVVAFLRLSADSEIIAFESSGVSLYQMLPPVVMLSFLGFLIAIMISVMAVPWGNRSFKNLIFEIAQSKADLGIKEHIFSEPFDDVIFYVNSFSSRDRVMKDVFVVDRRDKTTTNTIVAEEGEIFLHPDKRIITLHFLKGTIFVVEKNMETVRTIGFNTYDLNIDLKDIMAALESRRKAPKELSMGELIKQLEVVPEGDAKHNRIMIAILEKLSIPVAVLFMGIIGVPLGAQLRTRGRSEGIGVSLVVFLSYYICLAGMRSICETGYLSPSIGMWVPDIFLLLCCAYLLRLSAMKRPLYFLLRLFSIKDFLDSRIYILKRRWKGLEDLRPAQGMPGMKVVGEQLVLPLFTKAGERIRRVYDTEKCVATMVTGRFHRLDCKWAKKISSYNMQSFDKRDEAVRQGYIPCKVCNP